jgi:hypothetical protein
MRHWLPFSLSLLAVGAIIGAAAGSARAGDVVLRGQVTDRSLPLAGARIIARPAGIGEACSNDPVETTSDESGEYRLEFPCEARLCSQCFLQIEIVDGDAVHVVRNLPITADLCEGGTTVVDLDVGSLPTGAWRVVETEGIVEFRTPGGEWRDIEEGQFLDFNTEIATGFDGRLKVVYVEDFEDVMSLELEFLTTVTLGFDVFRPGDPGPEIEIEFGQIDLDVKKERLEADAKVSTPNSTSSIRGTSLRVRADEAVGTTTLFEGVIETELTCSGQVIRSSVEPCSADALQITYDASELLARSEAPGQPCRPGGIEGAFEAPAGDASGIVAARGWAFTRTRGARISSLVEVWIDGEYAFSAPCCADRGDVVRNFPEAPLRSGFAAAFNLGLVGGGEHVARAFVRSSAGETRSFETLFRTPPHPISPFLDDFTFFPGAPRSCFNITGTGDPATIRLTNTQWTDPGGGTSGCLSPGGFTFRWERSVQGFVQTSGCDFGPIEDTND